LDLKLVKGDYLVEGGRVQAAAGAQAALQRVQLALATRQGSFLAKPTFGSRLHLLLREKPSAREALAFALVQEALAEERNLLLEQVTLGERDDGVAVLTAFLRWQGEALTVAQVIT